MKDIVFKVALKGEGKTKWLLDVAHDCHASGHPVYIATKTELGYTKFCEKYFRVFGVPCPAEAYMRDRVCANSVVLIDDLIEQQWSTYDLSYLRASCYQLFVTVEGTSDYSVENMNYQQLSFSI